MRLPGSAYRAGPNALERVVQRATQTLRPVVQLVEGAGYDAIPVVVTSDSVADAIITADNSLIRDLGREELELLLS